MEPYLVEYAIKVGLDGSITNDVVTHGNSFADVYRGFHAIKAEIERQIAERRACPFHPRYGSSDPQFEESAEREAITVWSFHQAPEALRKRSQHGGDEDWLAVVPAGVEVPAWMRTGSPFGVCEVSNEVLDDGAMLCIGAHA